MGPMKLLKTAALVVVMLFLTQAPVHAQETAAGAAANPFSKLQAIGIGMTIIGAAWGIGTLAKGATESMARQPEIEGRIFTTALILAALIEGVTFLALIFQYLTA
jgi:F-type H+-transporting ATPase subunit c